VSGSGNGSGPRPLATGSWLAGTQRGPSYGTVPSAPYASTLSPAAPHVYNGLIGPESIDPQGCTDKLPNHLAELEAHVEQIHDADCSLLARKHVDYGKSNIADAPGGAYNGLIVRLHDKFSRLKHLHETGANPQNESVKDTLRDIRNYCVIAEMVIDGTWPK
jgi:hypothetical protein